MWLTIDEGRTVGGTSGLCDISDVAPGGVPLLQRLNITQKRSSVMFTSGTVHGGYQKQRKVSNNEVNPNNDNQIPF